MLNPLSALDTEVAVPPETGDSVAVTVVDVLKLEEVPYSNDTVVEARFAFTEPVSVAVVVPTGVAVDPLTVGGARKVKELFTVPPEPVSTTVTSPAAPAGVTTVTEMSLTLGIEVPAIPPKVTEDVPVKLVPVIVTVVPPDVEPVAGETEAIVGTPTYVKPPVLVAEPPGVVNTTFAAPAEPEGATTVTEVSLTLVSDVPEVPPIVTPVVPLKFVPVIVSVLPVSGPLDGETDVIVGAATYVKPPVLVAWPPIVVNTTSLAPTVPDGVVTVTDVALTVPSMPATPPIFTPEVVVKLVPVIVTVVPPAVGPLVGVSEVIVGAATNVKPPVLVAWPPGVVNTTSVAPAVPDGVVTVTDVAPTVPSEPATPPIVTPVVPLKLVPVIVTVVPPAIGPLDGLSVVIVGTAK